MTMTGFMTGALAIIVMIGVLVVVHEAGHFLVARYFGIGTPVFSVGMGPRLVGYRWRGTEFRLSAFPLGGYVQMAGADIFGEEDVDSLIPHDEHFMRKPVWQRLLVMLAGPAANLVLPFVLIMGALMAGEPAPDTMVGGVHPDSKAEQLGFQVDDKIVAVNDQPVASWTEVKEELAYLEHAPFSIDVVRDGEAQSFSFPAETVKLDLDGSVLMSSLGLRHQRYSTRVTVLDPQSPAFVAGLRSGDAILQIDGQEVAHFRQLAVLDQPGTYELTVLSRVAKEVTDTQTMTLQVTTQGAGLRPAEFLIGRILEESAAVDADLRQFDAILQIEGTPIDGWIQIVDLVKATISTPKEGETLDPDTLGRPIRVVINRDGEELTKTFRPKVMRQLEWGRPVFRPLMGIVQLPDAYAAGGQVNIHYGPLQAAARAQKVWTWSFTNTVAVLKNVITRQTYLNEAAGGPGTIALAAKQSAEAGPFAFLRTMAMISFSLGIMNLLPMPLLDGGRIVFYLLEWVRGRPLPLIVRERIEMVGILLLVALMLRVLVIDAGRIMDIFGGGG